MDGGKNVQGVERKGANWYRDQNSRIKKGRGQNGRGKRDGNRFNTLCIQNECVLYMGRIESNEASQRSQ